MMSPITPETISPAIRPMIAPPKHPPIQLGPPRQPDSDGACSEIEGRPSGRRQRARWTQQQREAAYSIRSGRRSDAKRWTSATDCVTKP
jgi:hypothetical protein